MKLRHCVLFLSVANLFAAPWPLAADAQTQKDYLSSLEADKIREADTPNERITLFLSFADDRIKKLQYELEHPSRQSACGDGQFSFERLRRLRR